MLIQICIYLHFLIHDFPHFINDYAPYLVLEELISSAQSREMANCWSRNKNHMEMIK